MAQSIAVTQKNAVHNVQYSAGMAFGVSLISMGVILLICIFMGIPPEELLEIILDYLINISLYWWIILGAVGISMIVGRLSSTKAGIIVFLILMSVIGVVASVSWLFRAATESIQQWDNITLDYGILPWRFLAAVVLFCVQMLYLYGRLANASQEKRTPYKLLNGIVWWTIAAAACIAFIPWSSAGKPLLWWSGGIFLANFKLVGDTVTLTTTFFKPNKNGNQELKAHGDSSIKPNLQTLSYGYFFALVIALFGTFSNLS